jgi:hypothetical protein
MGLKVRAQISSKSRIDFDHILIAEDAGVHSLMSRSCTVHLHSDFVWHEKFCFSLF